MARDLVSVIIPCYNAAAYVEGLASVFAQTYPELELVLVDDCSSDSTWEKLQVFQRAHADKRIVISRNESNLGAGLTRNQGLALSSGKYVCFWDADDKVDPSYVEKMLERIESEHADWCFCGCSVIKDGKSREYPLKPYLLSCSSTEELKQHVFELMPEPWLKLIRKDYLTQNEIRFPPLHCGEDAGWMLDLTLKASKIALLNEPLYTYVRRDGSLSSGVDSKAVLATIEELEFTYNYIVQNGYTSQFMDMWKKFMLEGKLPYFFSKFRHNDDSLRQFAVLFLRFCRQHQIEVSLLPVSALAKVRWYRFVLPILGLASWRKELKRQYYQAKHIERVNELRQRILVLGKQEAAN